MPDTLDRIIDQSFALHRVIRRHAHGELPGKKGLNLLHLHAMAHIAEHETVTMTQLAKCLKVSPSSATSFAARLHRMKYVERVRDRKNRKIVRLRLTKAGRALVAEAFQLHRAELRKILGVLPAEIQRAFAENLTSVMKFLSSL